jgi:cytochrome c oxidase cbb3-type subunit I/II
MLYRTMRLGQHGWHQALERRPLAFSILTLVAVLVGGLFELLPGLVTDKQVPYAVNGEMCVKPYTALELTGRDIFVREGCYVCHSQMIRPFRSEQLRYGDPSRLEESVWDHPFQWGSKRTGPDLARVGAKYDEAWHWSHMRRPQDVVASSIMPGYPWLYDAIADAAVAADKMRVLARLGVPYTPAEIANAKRSYTVQAAQICASLGKVGITDAVYDREIIALIGYLRRLGRNLEPAAKTQTARAGGGN